MSFPKLQIAAWLRSIFVAVTVLHHHVLCVPQGIPIFTSPLGFSFDCAKLTTNCDVGPLTASADVHTSALPDLMGPSSSTVTCGGCYIVADVAGIVWYSEIFINTGATAVVNVGVGNGTRATSTSLIRNEAQFTFNPSMATAMGSPLALTSVHYDSTVTVAGAVLYATGNY
jgi:hypothetical protein